MGNNGNSTEVETLQITNDLPEDLNVSLESLRCAKCGRFLGYYGIIEGTIAIKCRRCKAYSIIDVRAIDKDGDLLLK